MNLSSLDIPFRKSILYETCYNSTKKHTDKHIQLISLTYLKAFLRYDLSLPNSPPPPPPHFDGAQ